MTENKLKPYSSWIWDEEIKDWVTPNNKSVPLDGKPYKWDDEKLDWYEIEVN